MNHHLKTKVIFIEHSIQIASNPEPIQNPAKIQDEILIKNSKVVLPNLSSENKINALNNQPLNQMNEPSSSFLPNKEEMSKLLFGNDLFSINLNSGEPRHNIPNSTLSNSSLLNYDFHSFSPILSFTRNNFITNLQIPSNIFISQPNFFDCIPNFQYIRFNDALHNLNQ